MKAEIYTIIVVSLIYGGYALFWLGVVYLAVRVAKIAWGECP